MHPSGSVVATCSGQRRRPDLEEDSDDENNEGDEDDEESLPATSHARASDNTLKVWNM